MLSEATRQRIMAADALLAQNECYVAPQTQVPDVFHSHPQRQDAGIMTQLIQRTETVGTALRMSPPIVRDEEAVPESDMFLLVQKTLEDEGLHAALKRVVGL